MASSTKYVDPAFHGVGQKVGTEIWRIENFQPVPLPKADYGKFYFGDSYIVLQTTSGKGGAYLYDIHFWIGKESSQDEAGTAAIKTVELDAVLGGRAVQHRELQGFESDKFLSYFKPCIIPLEGGFASGFKKPDEDIFETRLYICRGKRVVRMKQIPFARSSLNHDDVFILDTEKKIYQFNGANSNIQERAKALEVVQFLKDKYHEGTCDVAIIDDGKLQAESDSGEFWVLFGGFAPIGKKVVTEDDVVLEASPAKLYSINDGQLKLEESTLSKAMLENYKCYLLDCGDEVFVWVGRVTQIEERKAASKTAEDFIASQNRPKTTRITQVIQGYEPLSFKSNFESWPAGNAAGASSGEEGRGKVAALLKQQGVDLKGVSKGSPTIEEAVPLLESGGKLEVWRINGSAKNIVPKEEIGKFYSGDCYIVLYTYHSSDKKEDYFLTCWIGKDSIQDDQIMATRLANTMWSSLKGRPVQGRIFQGKEPPQFIALFQPMIVLKGGISSGYKKFIAEKNLSDETYTADGIALIQVSGISVHNSKAIQVDAVATSLNSTDCFILQSGNSLFIWNGSSCTFEQQQWAARIAEFLKPGVAIKHVKEGTESSAFWFAIGGKQSFISKKSPQDIVRDPHLYSFLFKKGKLKVSEIFNYSQDDLMTEDMLILDTHAEVFVWIGQSVDSKDKQTAFEVGQKYIDLAVSLEGLPPDLPLYRITEGNEPCFFTTYFCWDSAKTLVQGNSFQKKLAHLFGTSMHSSESKSSAVNHDGPRQRASALAALSSAFNPSSTKITSSKSSRSGQGSQRAAAVAALSSVLTAEQKKGESETLTARFNRNESSDPTGTVDDSVKTESVGSDLGDSVELSAEKETMDDASVSQSNGAEAAVQDPETGTNGDETTFSYERLKTKSSNPVHGIDYKQREAYLSDAEFETVLGMTKEAFYRQPKWKQDMQKRKLDLF
ncbi:villin-2-like [Zingiber officinale]|uniref:villin-2-like n=1 Tax=Zingiber officinale TaxID=94328 RepID=UPI001C4D4155|nr:villin-2-like [Zingiber officinale]XP_042447004.1 villin-2-like [Zingiber officinale]XP_042447005.1 villin-2-like [Zingiber officinale]XP_042447006.1 villin-2-like [Zingiber officinale]XP_042447007.1 villin-2-like [Zingiber officinale]XP_042447008.1 villin-2-like [Zingiber officinale]XP_042447009.1 villin-2-like [Zingiber officinale]